MSVFLREFLNKKWSCGGLNHLLEKVDKFVFVLNALPVVVDHCQHVMLETLLSACELVHSQENHPYSHHSVIQIALEAHISCSSVHDIIKKDLEIELNFMF